MNWYKDYESGMFEPNDAARFTQVASQRLDGSGWSAQLESQQNQKTKEIETAVTLFDDYGNFLESWVHNGLPTAEDLIEIRKECEERYMAPNFYE